MVFIFCYRIEYNLIVYKIFKLRDWFINIIYFLSVGICVFVFLVNKIVKIKLVFL